MVEKNTKEEKELQSDIDSMLEVFDGHKEGKGEEDGEAELASIAKPAAVVEKGEDDEHKVEGEVPPAPVKDEPLEKEGGDETKVADDEGGDEGDQEDDTSLRKSMNEMAAQMQLSNEPKELRSEPAVVGKKESIASTPQLTTSGDLQITEEEYNEAMTSVAKFNDVVMKKAAAYTEGRVQEVLRSLGNTVAPMVQQVVDIRIAASDFYLSNPDLREFKPFVGMVANEIFAKNPDKPLDELFNITGKEVRKRLKLQKPTGSASMGIERKPSPAVVAPGRRSTRKPEPPKLTGMEDEINTMLEHDRRY